MDYQLALVIISVIAFFVMIALNLFFVYLPVYRIEKKIDNATTVFSRTEDEVKTAAISLITKGESIEKKIDQIIEEGEKFKIEAEGFALKAEIAFEEYKADICKLIGDLRFPKPEFCD